MKNLHAFLFVLTLISFSHFSYSKEIVVALESVNSRVDSYPAEEFKKDIIKVLKKNGISVDTTSTYAHHVSYKMRALISDFPNSENSFQVYFDLVNAKTNKTEEIYDRLGYKNTNEPVKSVVERAILAMRTFRASDEKDDYFMPGAAFDIYQPRNKDIGEFYGPSVEFVFYTRSKTSYSKRSGPSRIKSYGKIGILNSTFEGSSDLLMVSAGLNLSFEAKTDRNFLLPYFGLDLGGLYGNSLRTFQFTPNLGVQFVSTDRIIWSGQAGYLYSIRDFDQYSGYNFKTSLNVLLW
jgi:hypothetical protein